MILYLLFQACSRVRSRADRLSAPRLYSPHNLTYQRFKVMDDSVAQKLADWHDRQQTARAAIEDYLHAVFPPSRCATKTLYRVDERGYLKDVAYNGYVPDGWYTQEDEEKSRLYHWVEPRSSTVIKDITQMPLVPSYRDVATLIGWPYFDASDREEDAAILYHSVNRSLRVGKTADGVYLDIPFHDNFGAHADILERVSCWRVPRYLNPVSAISPGRGGALRL